jgi:hypothetical protein
MRGQGRFMFPTLRQKRRLGERPSLVPGGRSWLVPASCLETEEEDKVGGHGWSQPPT